LRESTFFSDRQTDRQTAAADTAEGRRNLLLLFTMVHNFDSGGNIFRIDGDILLLSGLQ
jgi:hypothetical protein